VPVRGVLELRDGTRVAVREIRAEDAPALRRLVGRSSERSIQLRFFGPLKELSEEEARRFAEVDGEDRFAVVALDPEDEIVAVARYERRQGSEEAEYAVLVEDGFQGRGLGSGLTLCLIEAAKERGIERLHALVLRENRRMLRLLSSLGLPGRRRWENGLEHVEIDLRPGAAA
jgi:RimJ/RimL family protein N-acetyltransferase